MHKVFVILAMLLVGCSAGEGLTESPVRLSADEFTLSPVEDLSGISAEKVYTFTCEIVEQKPSTATPYCADFGEAVFDIKWDTWGADGAEGTGIYSLNDCDPDCATGSRHESSATVRLSGLKTDGRRYFLTEFSYVTEKAVMTGRSRSGGWDTSEFYVNVPDMRSDG